MRTFTTPALFATAILAFSSSVAAQTCSGGLEGGMDATGNQCSVLLSMSETTQPGATADRSTRSARAPVAFVLPASAISHDASSLPTTFALSADEAKRLADALIEP